VGALWVWPYETCDCSEHSSRQEHDATVPTKYTKYEPVRCPVGSTWRIAEGIQPDHLAERTPAACNQLTHLHTLNTLQCLCHFLDPSGTSVRLTVDVGQLITWLIWFACTVKADLFCSDKLKRHRLLVKGLSVVASTSVLSSFSCVCANLSPSLTYVSILTIATRNFVNTIRVGCTSSLLMSYLVWLWQAPHVSSSPWPHFWICVQHRESDRSTKWIKEAVHIRKERRRSMNRYEGSYTLSHTYDRFLATSHHYRGKNRKKNWTSFFWRRSLERDRNVKVNIVRLSQLIFLYKNISTFLKQQLTFVGYIILLYSKCYVCVRTNCIWEFNAHRTLAC